MVELPVLHYRKDMDETTGASSFKLVFLDYLEFPGDFSSWTWNYLKWNCHYNQVGCSSKKCQLIDWNVVEFASLVVFCVIKHGYFLSILKQYRQIDNLTYLLILMCFWGLYMLTYQWRFNCATIEQRRSKIVYLLKIVCAHANEVI